MHVLIIGDPITSKLITTQALADRLQEEGHRVTLRIPPGRLDDAGLATLGLAVDLVDLRVGPPHPGPTAQAVVEFQAAIEAEAPDIVLIDTEAHEYIMAAVAADLPVVLLSVFFNLWKLPGVPPVHQDVVPGVGWRGSPAGIAYGWLGYRAFRLLDIARSTVRRNDRRHQLRAYARTMGLDPGALVTEFHGLIPFGYRSLPTLTLNLPELELPGAQHRLNRYVGPMPKLTKIGRAAETADAVLAEVDALRATHPDTKLIYGAFGAYYEGDDLGFWRRAIDAVGSRPDWIGVFGLGGRIDADQLGPLPDNVLAFPWAPQIDILERADCAMIHAGMTSVYECIHQRVPMVVYPLGDSFDQYGTAARVAHRRIGLVGVRETVTAAEILGHVDQVMADGGLEDRLDRFGAAMDRCRSERSASAALEELAVELHR